MNKNNSPEFLYGYVKTFIRNLRGSDYRHPFAEVTIANINDRNYLLAIATMFENTATMLRQRAAEVHIGDMKGSS